MALVYNNDVKEARMEAVIDAIDADTDEGYIEIGTGPAPALGTLLVKLELNKPSFAVDLTGAPTIRINMATTPAISGDAIDSGTAAAAQIRDGDDVIVVSGLVVGTAAPAEIVLNATAISVGQTVSLQSGVITHG